MWDDAFIQGNDAVILEQKVDAFTVRFETNRLQRARCIRYGHGFDVGPIAKVVIDGDRLLCIPSSAQSKNGMKLGCPELRDLFPYKLMRSRCATSGFDVSLPSTSSVA